MHHLKNTLPLMALATTIFSAPAPLTAAPPVQLIADINTIGLPADSDASQFAEMNGRVYYRGYSPDTGHELWRTDGTEAGTAMVSDILSGPDGSEPTNITAHGNHIYFLARGETNSTYFWKSDGTKAGTVQPLAGQQYTVVTNFHVSATGHIYLEVAAGQEHRVLCIAPTGQKSILKRIPSLSYVVTTFLGDAGPHTYFTHDDQNLGRELWRTNGTAAGTHLISDISPGPAATEFRGFAILNDSAYFLRQDGLWRTDATLAGASRVKDLVPSVNGNNSIAIINNTLIFAAGDNYYDYRLWKSDGTTQGTQPVGSDTGIRPYNFVTAGNFVYFIAEANTTSGSYGSPEVWRTDGTAAGTVMLTDFNTPGDTVPTQLTPVGDKVYFRSSIDGNLYTTDGSIAGTQLIKEFESGYESVLAEWPTAAFGTSVIFTAKDATGHDLWISDGTAAGTELVYEPIQQLGSDPQGLTSIGDKWYFYADNGTHGIEPWVSDGTPGGTFMLKDINPGPESSMYDPLKIVEMNGKAYFSADDGQGPSALWVSDGTSAGTVKVTGSDKPGISSLSIFSSGDKLFFSVYTPETGREIWVSDGTDAGTNIIADLFPHISARPNILGTMNGEVYFYGSHYESDSSSTPQYDVIWKSDGTAAGSVLLAYLDPATHDTSPGLYPLAVNNTLYFSRRTAAHGLELYKTDGTPAGTGMVTDLQPGVNSSAPRYFTELDGQFYFTAHGPSPINFYKTDGTAAGTQTVFDAPGNLSIHPELTTVVDGKFFFGMLDHNPPRGLWQSDATAAGTRKIHHLDPIKEIVAANRDALYIADNGTHGEELWLTNSSGTRTEMVWDINPDSGSSPRQLTPGPRYVLFTANDGQHGRELYRLDTTQMWPASADTWELYE